MNFQPVFRIHLADPLGLVDTPFIVTAAYATAAGLPRAEWFLVIPEGKGMVYSQLNKLDQQAFSNGPLLLDEELLLNAALDQATLRLRRHIIENKGNFAPLLLAKQLEIHPGDLQHLVKLWMRGLYCGCLSEIRAKSECVPLIDTLSWIHGLPMLTTIDL